VSDTTVEVRLTLGDPDAGIWHAELVDVEANVSWFTATGPTPILAVTRLCETVGEAYSKQSWELTELIVERETSRGGER
jgi:hypothetical protein